MDENIRKYINEISIDLKIVEKENSYDRNKCLCILSRPFGCKNKVSLRPQK